MAAPLTGITVLDLSTVVAGPLCTMILGDLGADVIKIEAPGGDIARSVGPPFKGGLGAMFASLNRNKRSIVLDLKQPDGFHAFTTLVESADVLVHNFRPGVAERLGIGAQAMLDWNPRLIYCGMLGFGRTGPLAQTPCYDTVLQGLSGMTTVQGEGTEPTLVRSLIADKVAGLTATYAIQAALVARTRTGQGQAVELSMLDSFISFLFPDACMRQTFLPEAEYGGLPSMGSLHRTWRARDGYLTAIMVSDEQFAGFARACSRPEWIHDPRFADLPQRVQHYAELEPEIIALMKTRTVEEWLEAFGIHGVPATRAHTVESMMRDPQVIANGTFIQFAHPAAGPQRMPQPPAVFNGQRLQVERGAPQLGEHTAEVLREFGIEEDMVTAYVAGGAAHQA